MTRLLARIPVPHLENASRTTEKVVRPPEDSRFERIRRILEGRYTLERFLDRGGTSQVYLARERLRQRRVVIKVLSEQAAQNPILRGHFLTGYRAAKDLDHANVVKVFAVEEDAGGTPYVVLELLSGEPLCELLVREGTLKTPLALRLAWQVAAGLERIHKACVVHCDIKPENLFLCQTDGPTSCLKILDLGLAVVGGREVMGEPHIVKGTAQYMAPEQIVGDAVDARTDLYALGVVLFRMLTGQLPFDLKLSATLLKHQLGSPAPPPSWLNEELEPGIERIVLRALQKHPDNRYQTPAEFRMDLECALAGRAEEVSAFAPRVTPDLYRPQSERGWAAAALLGG